MPTIAQILNKKHLSEWLLDAEVLLAHVLQVSRTYLRAYPERELSMAEQEQFYILFEQRKQGKPVAYLTGHQEFWSLDLQVTPDTLIPRPETELLVELTLALCHKQHATVADLGTGSGAIALALATERPDWKIHATDKSAAALTVAQHNATCLQIHTITFQLSDWCDALPALSFDMMVSNPPYIADNDINIEQTVLRYEPRSALIAAEQGLCDLQTIIQTARAYLRSGGWLLLEHGFEQGEAVRHIFVEAGYVQVVTHRDLAGLERVTVGQWS